MDWYGSASEPGMLSFQAANDLIGFKPVASADYYCVPGLVRELADFGQRGFCVQGWPDVPEPTAMNQGFTWRTWWNFYAEHLDYATRLDTREAQLDWLDYAHDQGLNALRLMGETAKGILKSSVDITSKELKYLLTWDCAPANALREQVALHKLTKTDSAAYHRLQAGTSRAVNVDALKRQTLPLRSDRHGQDKGGKRRRGDNESDGSRPPGSLASTVGWLTPDHEFYASGQVWDMRRLAACFKVQLSEKCWGFLLNRKPAANRMACCPTPFAQGHRSPTDEAHRLNDLIVDQHMATYSRAATPEEKAKFPHPYGRHSEGQSSTATSIPDEGQHFGMPARP